MGGTIFGRKKVFKKGGQLIAAGGRKRGK